VSGEQPWCGSVDEFLRDVLRHIYARPIDGRQRVWAAEWWRYPEAIVRLTALWSTWEQLRLDSAMGMSLWYRYHADHHMPILMSPQGPFAPADTLDPANHCLKGDPLPYRPAPAGMFPPVPHLSGQ
jgi:hypothetical protein